MKKLFVLVFLVTAAAASIILDKELSGFAISPDALKNYTIVLAGLFSATFVCFAVYVESGEVANLRAFQYFIQQKIQREELQAHVDEALTQQANTVEIYAEELERLHRGGVRALTSAQIDSDQIQWEFYERKKDIAYSYERAEKRFLHLYDQIARAQEVHEGIRLLERSWKAYVSAKEERTGTDG